MLMIRLQRVGRKNYAEFRIVVTEKTRAAKSSNYVELLGYYNPHTDVVALNEERVQHWLEVGAKPSDTMHNILVEKGIIKGKKRNVLPKKTPIKKEEAEANSTPAEEKKEGVDASEKEEEETVTEDPKEETTEKA